MRNSRFPAGVILLACIIRCMGEPALIEQTTDLKLSSEVESHFQKVVESPHFARAETLRKILIYLWTHRDQPISEYAIATEALGRRADFDPKNDASVRVQISRLRRKLKDYYEQERSEREIIQIPTGTHQLLVSANVPEQPEPTYPPTYIEPVTGKTFSNRLYLILGQSILCVALLILSCILLWQKMHAGPVSAQRPHPNIFWTQFISNNVPVKIILPTPTFFSFSKQPDLRIRDVNVNDFNEQSSLTALSAFASGLGKPTLEQTYTVTSDTLAALDLARYLDSVGLEQQVSFDVTRDSSMQVLEQANIVAFGAHGTLHPFRDYLAAMNFSLGPGEAWVNNAHPASGEKPRYEVEKMGHNRQIEPALIAVLPGRAPGLKVLLLQSRHTSALVSLLISRIGEDLVEKMLQTRGNPPFFEMVVFIESDGDHILRSWPVALHPYTRSAPVVANVTQ